VVEHSQAWVAAAALYGSLFWKLTIAGVVLALIAFAFVPVLKRGMQRVVRGAHATNPTAGHLCRKGTPPADASRSARYATAGGRQSRIQRAKLAASIGLATK
jgi:hypothetical protein